MKIIKQFAVTNPTPKNRWLLNRVGKQVNEIEAQGTRRVDLSFEGETGTFWFDFTELTRIDDILQQEDDDDQPTNEEVEEVMSSGNDELERGISEEIAEQKAHPNFVVENETMFDGAVPTDEQFFSMTLDGQIQEIKNHYIRYLDDIFSRKSTEEIMAIHEQLKEDENLKGLVEAVDNFKIGSTVAMDDEEEFQRALQSVTGQTIKDNPIKPHHYHFGKITTWDIVVDWNLGFFLGNTIKYIQRAPHKGNLIEDLEKAAEYLRKEIELQKGK